jgi:hypothetical protein
MEYTESEILAANLQTDARIALMQRRASYYGFAEENKINREEIFRIILESNRKNRRKDFTKGNHCKIVKMSDLQRREEREHIAAFTKEKEDLEKRKEEAFERGRQKEILRYRFDEIQTRLSNSSNEDSLVSLLTILVDLLNRYLSEVQESNLDEIDKIVFTKRLEQLDIANLEAWMHSLKYDVLQRMEDIGEIRQQIEIFSEITGIPLQFELEMHTEDDEAFCQQLLAEEEAERARRYPLSF